MTQPRSMVAKRIQRIRKAKQWSRQRLADELGVTYLQVYRIETGITQVHPEDVRVFAVALGVHSNELCSDINDLVVRRAS